MTIDLAYDGRIISAPVNFEVTRQHRFYVNCPYIVTFTLLEPTSFVEEFERTLLGEKSATVKYVAVESGKFRYQTFTIRPDDAFPIKRTGSELISQFTIHGSHSWHSTPFWVPKSEFLRGGYSDTWSERFDRFLQRGARYYVPSNPMGDERRIRL